MLKLVLNSAASNSLLFCLGPSALAADGPQPGEPALAADPFTRGVSKRASMAGIQTLT